MIIFIAASDSASSVETVEIKVDHNFGESHHLKTLNDLYFRNMSFVVSKA